MPQDADQQAADAFLAAIRACAGGTFTSTSPQQGDLLLTPLTQPRRAVYVSFLHGGAFISFGSINAESDIELAQTGDGNGVKDATRAFDWALTKVTRLIEHGSFRRLPLLELFIPGSVDEARSLARSLLAVRCSRPWWDDHNRIQSIPWTGPDAPTSRAELTDYLTRALGDRWNHWEGRSDAGIDPLSAAGMATALIPATSDDHRVIVDTFSTRLATGDDGGLDLDAAAEWLIDRFRDRLPGAREAVGASHASDDRWPEEVRSPMRPDTRRGLKQRIFSDTAALTPSDEMPSLASLEPPLSPQHEQLIADVMDVQAATASSLTWAKDADGAARRQLLRAQVDDLTARCQKMGLARSESLLSAIAHDLGAYDATLGGASIH